MVVAPGDDLGRLKGVADGQRLVEPALGRAVLAQPPQRFAPQHVAHALRPAVASLGRPHQCRLDGLNGRPVAAEPILEPRPLQPGAGGQTQPTAAPRRSRIGRRVHDALCLMGQAAQLVVDRQRREGGRQPNGGRFVPGQGRRPGQAHVVDVGFEGRDRALGRVLSQRLVVFGQQRQIVIGVFLRRLVAGRQLFGGVGADDGMERIAVRRRVIGQ